MSVIKFGTDGWRGIIAEEFTFDNVRLCAAAVARYLNEQGLAERGLVIGYDTRFASEGFGAAVAEVTTAAGVSTFLLEPAAPTPVTSYTLVHRHAGGGVVITASHNPARWNGFKYKPEYGGSASPQVVEALERHIAQVEATGSPRRLSLEEAASQGTFERIDPRPAYLEHIARLVDLDGIRKAGLTIVADAMYGAGAGYFPALLAGGSTRLIEIRGERNPIFPGMSQPEPVAHNLDALFERVGVEGADAGIALDGDADRVGACDEQGRYLTPLQIFALLAFYLLEVRGERGPLVKSLTSTAMLYRLGELYQVPVFETPVGFKYIGPVMMEQQALIGGEESGGFGFRGHIPERDGILSGLFLLDMMVKTGKTLSQLMAWLYEKVGPHEYTRLDLSFASGRRDEMERHLEGAAPARMAGLAVRGRDATDGLRFTLEGGAWVVVRFSGTEPLLRIYAEAESQEQARRLVEAMRELAGM